MDLEQKKGDEDEKKTPLTKRQSAYEFEKTLKQYRKTDIVNMLASVIDLPKDRIGDVYTAFCSLLVELSFTESVVHIPKMGRFVFDPKCKRKVWNPKLKRTLFYQNPRVVFKVSHKLRSLLRKQHRRNCYQLAELNNLDVSNFVPWEILKERRKAGKKS